MTTVKRAVEPTLQALEAELGEPLLYRAAGRIAAAKGLASAPVGSWGLFLLTPTRIVFHHFAQNSALFGGKDVDVRLEVGREKFQTCQAVTPGSWAKFFSQATDQVLFTGTGVALTLELGDHPRNLLQAWTQS